MRRLLLALLLLAGCAAGNPRDSISPAATPANGPAAVRSTPIPSTAPPAPTPTQRPTAAGPTPSPPPATITLAAVGDIMLARSIGERITSVGPDAPLAAVATLLSAADLTIANLECALGPAGEPAAKAYRFLGPAAGAQTLAGAGIDVVSLANNHSLDWGVAALSETQRLLDQAGVRHVGAGDSAAVRRPLRLTVGGLRLALLAYANVPVERGGFDTASWIAGPHAPGLAWADPAVIAADVAAARLDADHVLVLLHSGYEGLETPNEIQRSAAYAAIDAGATLVLGAHPHVLQGLERRGAGLIAYSLGNFAFDDFDGIANDSAILTITLDRTSVRDYRWTPVRLVDGVPQPLDPLTDGAAILARLEALSAALR